MTRDELIAALEAAEGPSRELDAKIWLFAVPDATRKQGSYVHTATGRLCHIDETRRPDGMLIVVPNYTASVDAALTLVPEGWTWDMNANGSCCLTGPGDEFGHYPEWDISAQTPALALCIAALKARAA